METLWITPCRNHIFDYFQCPVIIKKNASDPNDNNLTGLDINKYCKSDKRGYYIDECYELFHVSGDEYVANEVNKVLKLKGAVA
mgnify:CR=1 FL=1